MRASSYKKEQQNGIRLYTLINLDILVEMTAKALKSLVILFFAYFNNKRYLCFKLIIIFAM